jgi:cytochrome c
MAGVRPEPDVDVPPGDAQRGAKLFKAKCAQCHTAEEGGTGKHGPPLWALFGREAGTGDFHAYSDANRSSGIIWSERHLFQFLISPRRYLTGTRMVFAGMKISQERADLIAFLATCK